MSLQELGFSPLHLVLSIREGHGFGFLHNPILLVAATSGISLETEPVPPSPDPVFRTDLAWETDKKSLRRFRTSNTPVKIECFTVSNTRKRDCIGSVLLNIKSAQVIPSSSQLKVTERWHKLVGVPPEAKALQPELLLSLTVQDSNPSMVVRPDSSTTWLRGTSHGLGKSLRISQMSVSSQGDTRATMALPCSEPQILYQGEGHIQLGPASLCTDHFLLSLHVENAVNLGQLPHDEGIPSEGENKLLRVAYNLFSHTVSAKPFSLPSDCRRVCEANESVVIHLHTSLVTLHSYLQEHPCAALHLFLHEQEIGATELHLRALVPTDDLLCFQREFGAEIVCSQRCLWVSSQTGSIPRAQDGSRPYIEVSAKLQLVSLSSVSDMEGLTSGGELRKSPVASICPVQFARENGDGDHPSRCDSQQSHNTFILPEDGPKWVPVNIQETPRQPEVKNESCLPSKVGYDELHNFSVNIKFRSVVFYYLPESSRIRFLFDCPHSHILMSTLTDAVVIRSGDSVSLAGIGGSLTLLSSIKDLPKELSKINHIQLNVAEVGADPATTRMYASTKINIQALNLPIDGNKFFSAVLEDKTRHSLVGHLFGIVMLEDHGKHHCPKIGEQEIVQEPVAESVVVVQQTIERSTQLCGILSKSPVNPVGVQQVQQAPSVDSATAYRYIVEELEDWKEKQQEIFTAEMKRKEADHLAQLREEAEKHRKEQESEIERNINYSKALVQSLTHATQDLKERNKRCAQHEQELKKAKAELEQQYNLKFQELTLAGMRLDKGVKLQASLADVKCSQLEEQLSSLQSENKSLRRQLYQLQSDYKAPTIEEQKCGLNHNQTTKLLGQVKQLEEKLKTSLHSKAFFKEQWGRAVREMNLARAQLGKPEHKYRLEEVLGKEKAELQNDRKALEEVREQLAICKEGNVKH